VNLTGNKIKARTLDEITCCLVRGATADEASSPESTGRMSESDQEEPAATQEQDAISLLVGALNQAEGSHQTVPMAQKQEREGKNGEILSSEEPGDEDGSGDEVVAERANVDCSAPLDFEDSAESELSSAAGSDDEDDTDATMIVHDDEENRATRAGNLENTASEFYAEFEKIASEQYSGEDDDDDDEGGDLLKEVPVPQQYEVVRTPVIVNKGSHGSYCMMY
jgi:hypothetical protein